MKKALNSLILLSSIIVVGFIAHGLGYKKGHETGYGEGQKIGYEEGHEEGHEEGERVGHASGYRKGRLAGQSPVSNPGVNSKNLKQLSSYRIIPKGTNYRGKIRRRYIELPISDRAGGGVAPSKIRNVKVETFKVTSKRIKGNVLWYRVRVFEPTTNKMYDGWVRSSDFDGWEIEQR